MKIGTVLLGAFFTLMSVNPALARGRHGHHYEYGHHNSHHYDSGHHNGHHDRHHNVHYYDNGHHDTYREVHHSNNRHQGDNAAYLIGGLILGGIVGAAINQSNHNPSYNANYRQPAYTNPYR